MRPTDIAGFSSATHAKTVSEMRERREAVHAKGEEVYRRTGKMDPLVSVHGKVRKSRFVWTPNGDGTFTLNKGFKRPYMFATDGTGSFAEYIGKAFEAAPKIYSMMEGNCEGHHQMDFSFSVFQDRNDHHAVVQVPEFESDNRFAEHMRLLVPDRNGGDAPEDYDLGIWYAANRVRSDLFLRYGGKGIFVLLLDAPGRGSVESRLVREHLGVELQSDVETSIVWQQLLKQFHAFVVVFGSRDTARWWQPVVGQGHMIVAPSHELFAEVQSGLVYVTDNDQPTEAGLYEFLRAGGANSGVSKSDASRIWRAYVEAKVPFGANAKLGIELPKPGDIFASMTDMWPIGHPRFEENAMSPVYNMDDEPDAVYKAPEPRKPIDWSRF